MLILNFKVKQALCFLQIPGTACSMIDGRLELLD